MAPEALEAVRGKKTITMTKPLPDMYDLPSEYPEEPGLPDSYHFLQGILLTETLDEAHFSATDLNVYFDKDNTGRHKRPDWFMALGIEKHYKRDLRRSYVVWQEAANPFLIVELISDSTIGEDLGIKKSKPGKLPNKWEAYEHYLKVPYYVVYDYIDANLTVYQFRGGKLRFQKRPLEEVAHFPEINLTLKVWFGTFRGERTYWLRWFKADGTMVPTHEETVIAERAEKERERAEKEQALADLVQTQIEKEQLLALLKKAGINPDDAIN